MDYSDSGDVVAVGSNFRSTNASFTFTGNVRVFEYERSKDLWQQLGGDLDGQVMNQFFGRPVVLAEKALRMASASGGDFPDVDVFEYNRKANDWLPLGDSPLVTSDTGPGFPTGLTMSAHGDIVAVGRVQANEDTGFTRVFQYHSRSRTWKRMGKDIPGKRKGDQFGAHLAMSYRGSILAVGSPGASNGRGNVEVFRYSSKAKEWKPLGSPIKGVRSGDGVASVSMSADGHVLAIGRDKYDGPNNSTENIGQVRVFYYDSKDRKDWVQLGSDLLGVKAGDQLGRPIDLNANGDILAAGAINFQQAGQKVGHVRVFKFHKNKDQWMQLGQDEDLLGDAEGDQAGTGTELDGSGRQVAVGIGGSDISGNGAGAVRVYEWTRVTKMKRGSPRSDVKRGEKH